MSKHYNVPAEYIEAQRLQMAAHERVKNDPARPRLHFVSPAHMLIDVWGAILHDGWYHLFYDTNYNNDPDKLGGTFGHIRSRDLLDWENLPFALMPDEKNGENGLNDGTVVIAPSGKPLMYYTRCFFDRTKKREHVAVRGSDDLVSWQRLPDELGRLTQENHGGPRFHMSWSDPIIFTEKGRTFMIISKCYPPDTRDFRDGVIPIYEATDDTLLNWEYRGIFAEHTGEVLNFIKVGEKWVLIYSPYDNPRWFVGSFDFEACRFVEQSRGILSYGYVSQGDTKNLVSRGFYATAAFADEEGEPCVIGWLSGFEGNGWEGCVSHARRLSLDSENRLLMQPHPALMKLRRELRLPDRENRIGCTDRFELFLTLSPRASGKARLSLDKSFELTITDSELVFNDITVPYESGENIKIRMLVDVSVAEIFIDDGRASISRCFSPITDINAAVVLSHDGAVEEFCLYTLEK